MAASQIKYCIIFLTILNFELIKAKENNLLMILEEKFENKLSDFSFFAAKWLENFNDKHLGNSELGRMLHYKDLKPKLGAEARDGKSMKKMGMAMIPLVFHVGATSTWMILTSIMAAKSVAIGLALLVFKIAVSSAKVASFFTALKGKHSHHEYSWSPPIEHHGSYYSGDWNSYSPEVSNASPPYKTIPTYKSHEPYEVAEYSEEPKSHS
ncbi:uncharacterized protein LOC111349995 isoform X2 [Spodoptera litura]|uniref:Uncharacterized protein LOC111349995 isoform X2 n=1 Tax=Spodoptera litura TaxID=69820 RepID=A0A9J7DRK5_SPOLT|nr:uncharacterized protein LOC111349995 isoform X2 [Spodoptera litura]